MDNWSKFLKMLVPNKTVSILNKILKVLVKIITNLVKVYGISLIGKI